MKPYIKQIGKILLLIVIVQLVRGLVFTGLWKFMQPQGDTLLWVIMDMIAFCFVGYVLLLVFHPSAEQVSLEWDAAPRWERIAYLAGGGLLLLLVMSSYFLGPDILVTNIGTVVILPMFEEFIFRGWSWKQLEQVDLGKYSQVIHWLVISLLFGIWHFGYLDVYLLKMNAIRPVANWGEFFVMKFITTFIIGLIVGVPRGVTKRPYGSFLLHALINLFGR
jgi:membrane protease YdiL (CAAX protease family)